MLAPLPVVQLIKNPAPLRDGRHFPRYHPSWSHCDPLHPTAGKRSAPIITLGMRPGLLAIYPFTQTAPEGTSLDFYPVRSQSMPYTSLWALIQLLSSFLAFQFDVHIIDNSYFLSSIYSPISRDVFLVCGNKYPDYVQVLLPGRLMLELRV